MSRHPTCQPMRDPVRSGVMEEYKTDRLNQRVTPEEKRLWRRAWEASGQFRHFSDWVRYVLTQAAKREEKKANR